MMGPGLRELRIGRSSIFDGKLWADGNSEFVDASANRKL
jgi:hypothetical protein